MNNSLFIFDFAGLADLLFVLHDRTAFFALEVAGLGFVFGFPFFAAHQKSPFAQSLTPKQVSTNAAVLSQA